MSFLVNIFLLTVVWTSVQCSKNRDKIFFIQKSSDNETLLVVTWIESHREISAGCEMFKDQDLIDEVLRSSGGADIETISEDQMQNALGDCTEFTLKRRRRETDDETSAGISIEEDDVDPKEVRGNGSRRRKPQERRRQDPNNGRKPQEGRQRGARRTSTTTRANDVDTTIEIEGRQEAACSSSSSRCANDVDTTTETGGRQEAARRTSSTDSVNDVDTTEAETTTMGYDGIPVIFPGTKWCGAGDRAKHYDDLGLHQDTDRCCRAHDLCNDTLAPKETKNNLTNSSPFTKLSCKCDNDFYDCLDRVNSVTSNTIGNMYFNILKRECYKSDYPDTKKCKKYRTFLKLKCMEYEKDTSKPKVYQWVPAKKYKKIPFPGPLTITLPF